MTTTDREQFAESLIPIACDLICRVRDHGPDSTGDLLQSLSSEQWWALPVVLAAMVPTDRSVADLLAWTTTWVVEPDNGPILQPCGTHAAYIRHKKHDEPPCGPCERAERTYQRNRKRRARVRQPMGVAA